MKILLVEDNPRLSKNIRALLRKERYAVDCALNATEGLSKSADEPYDLFIIDRMLPDGDGLSVCKSIRADNPGARILMLTAKSQMEDKVEGLNAGADDYVTKPFDAPELMARIRSLLRRNNDSTHTPEIKVGSLTLDTNARRVTQDEKEIPFSPKEYSLFEYLVFNRDIAVSRDRLLSHIWDEEADPFSNTVDVHIAFIRTKLKKFRVGSVFIKTVRNIGYMLTTS